MNSHKRTGRHAAWLLAASLSAATVLGTALPARAQDSTVQEIRLRQLEAEVRNLQRQAPAATAPAVGAPTPGVPVATPLTDVLTRMDALEAQVARLTAQNEELANRLRQIEARLAPPPAAAAAPTVTPAPAPTPEPAPAPLAARSATAGNLSAMTGGASASHGETRPAGASRPSAERVAAVKAVIKPQTGDAGLDEYSYGYRLYSAKFYPEAAQQLKLYIDKYPKDAHISHARNLLGRAYLDDGKPRDAAPWFLQNYKLDPQGPRAADSLLNLADAMRQLGDNSRACIALNEFAATYATEAKGRLRQDYDKTRGGLSCN